MGYLTLLILYISANQACFLFKAQQFTSVKMYNVQVELMQSNCISTPQQIIPYCAHSATCYLQHWVPGTRRGRSCSSGYWKLREAEKMKNVHWQGAEGVCL